MLTRSILCLLLLSGAACGQTISNGEQVVPYSANLTLNAGYSSASVTLTGNVSSISVATGSFGGQSFYLTACQGAGGPYTIPATWSHVTGATTMWPTGCTRYHLVWDDPASLWVSTMQGSQIAASQISGLAPSATTDATNASNLASGTVPPGRLPVFGASGSSHAIGAVPDPGSTAGATRYLREDGTWVAPSASSGVNSATAYSAPYYASGGAAISGVSGAGVPVYSTTAAPAFTALTGGGSYIPTTSTSSATTGAIAVFSGTGGGIQASSTISSSNVLYTGAAGLTFTGANTFSGGNSFTGLTSLAAVKHGRATVSNAAYTVTSANYEVAYTSLSAAQTVTLTAASSIGTSAYPQYFVIKDETGNAGTYNITVSVSGGGTIDGASSKVINAAYGELRVYSNGTAYFTW